jgi:ATP synthase protein I
LTSDPEERRLAELEAQISAAQARNAPPPRTQEGKAWSIGAEFVGGVLVGAGIGWWLDKWLGTKPWLFILLMILGFVVGTVNAMRFAKRIETSEETEIK